jgi:hypothetical protein
MEQEFKIRPLTRKDIRTLSAMIVKMTEKIGNAGLLNLISSEVEADAGKGESAPGLDKTVGIGIEIIKLLFSTLEEDITAWFASLVGVTPEDFDNLPLDIEIKIIEQIKNSKEVSDFFSGASQLFSGIGTFKNMFRGENGKLDSATA